jgi:hypothetical protein
VTAATALQTAQSTVTTAKDALDALNTRIADGDTTVTGADLVAAEAAVTVADRIQTGAEKRATAETDAAQAAAAEAAIATLKSDYTSSADTLSAAVATAITGIESLIATALDFRASAGANLSAAMSFGPAAVGISRYQRLQAGTLAGFGSVQPPSPSAIVKGLQIIALTAAAGKAVPSRFDGPGHLFEGEPGLRTIARFLPSVP